jgi:ER membrane protein complex subunit 1, C-terminal
VAPRRGLRPARLWGVSLATGQRRWTRALDSEEDALKKNEGDDDEGESAAVYTVVSAPNARSERGPVVLVVRSTSEASQLRWVDAWSGADVFAPVSIGPVSIGGAQLDAVRAVAPLVSEQRMFVDTKAAGARSLALILSTSQVLLTEPFSASVQHDAVFHTPCDREGRPSVGASLASAPAVALCGFRVSPGSLKPWKADGVAEARGAKMMLGGLDLLWSVSGAEAGGGLIAWTPALDHASRASQADTSSVATPLGDDSLLLSPTSPSLLAAVFGVDRSLAAQHLRRQRLERSSSGDLFFYEPISANAGKGGLEGDDRVAASVDVQADGTATTTTTTTPTTPPPTTQATTGAVLMVVEGVSGRVAYSGQRAWAEGPAFVSRVGESFVFSAWNGKARRSELAAVAAHGGRVGTFALNPLRGWRTLGGDGGEVEVLERSFVLPQSPRAMAVSSTHGGIARRRLLLGTESGMLVAYEERLVSARRPAPQPRADGSPVLNMQEAAQALQASGTAEAKEGLLPASHFLPLSHLDAVSYNHTLPRIRLVRTVPAELESSFFVFSAGLDLFGARVAAAAKPFDEMDPAFPFGIVAALMVAAVAVTVASAVMLQRKRTADAWK